ncbi:MAG: hypothetical protein EWM50_06430 [Gottschalkiaceae bacterium]|nr:MAG: hypothetical protein EWM50_06430 [Gottschalkiaceae bacterium]
MLLVEDLIPIVKNTISTSIKHNTIRGYIGWSSCDNICIDMHDCLDICEKTFVAEEYLLVLEVASYILLSGVKLASSADSSSGMLTDVIVRTYQLIERCTKEIAKQDKQIRDVALGIIIKEAKKKAFDGWINWRYDLIKHGICLCDEVSAIKLEKTLDGFLTVIEGDCFPEYKKQEDMITRYLLHRHLYGKEATRDELYENIHISDLRIIAIKDAMEDSNFKEAEKLCKEKLVKDDDRSYRKNDPEDWDNILFDNYVAAGDTDKQIEQAKKILLFGNERFWETLKQIYKKAGVWKEKYPELLDELKRSNKSVCYRYVLIAENEKQRLLEDVTNNPYDLFYYGKHLIYDYPEQIYALCYKVISSNCAQARDRREYRKVTKDISQLIKWNGNDIAWKLIAELKQTYPKKPALIDELEKVERKLG